MKNKEFFRLKRDGKRLLHEIRENITGLPKKIYEVKIFWKEEVQRSETAV